MHTNFHNARHANDEEEFAVAVPTFLQNLGNERDKHCDVGRQEEIQSGGKGSALLPTLTISNQQQRGPPQLPITSSMQRGREQQATSVNGGIQ